MAQSINTFMDMGWSQDGFAARTARRYWVKSGQDNALHLYEQLIWRKPSVRRAFRTIMTGLERGGPFRLRVLKNRKAYWTTLALVLAYDIATHVPLFYSGHLAHTDDTTSFMLEQVKLLHWKCPEELRPWLGRSNENEMMFGARYRAELEQGELGLQSRICAATAGGRFPFAGYTLRMAHFSEGSKWKGSRSDVTELQVNVLNSIPAQGPSLVIDESTALGKNNIYYENWDRAWKKKSSPDGLEWGAFFAKWTEDPDNAYPVPPTYDWGAWPVDDREHEQFLVRYHDLSREQLYFRRAKIVRDCNGQLAKFSQDYPLTPEEAFINQELSAFAPGTINAMRQYLLDCEGQYRCTLRSEHAAGTATVRGW